MRGPERYVEWINSHIGFNPRGQENSNAMSEYIQDDLILCSPNIAKLVKTGAIVPKKNGNVKTRFAVRNIDFVFQEGEKLPEIYAPLCVENKTIMTAHGKARKNRYGDIIAYCNHVHNHRPDCVAGATLVVNVSEQYENPDSFARGIQRKKVKIEQVVADTIEVFQAIPLRDTPDEPTELPEALAVIVVNYDGMNPGSLITDGIAPSVTNPVNYDNFIERLAAKYEDRFCR
jgi:hypothetical protein